MNFKITIIVCLSKVDLFVFVPFLVIIIPTFGPCIIVMIQLLKLINVLTIMIIVSLDTYCGYQIIAHPTFNH